jgi:RNA recognition motif-containing protein
MYNASNDPLSEKEEVGHSPQVLGSSSVWSDGERSVHSGLFFGSYGSRETSSVEAGPVDLLGSSLSSPQELSAHGGFVESSMPRASRRLIVSGLGPDVEQEDVLVYFSQFGALEECNIVKDTTTGKCKGVAFVIFISIEDGLRAMSVTDHRIGQDAVDVRFASADDLRALYGTTRIFVARIPSSVNQPDFKAYFESFGPIRDAYMPRDSSKIGHRGIGFITYVNPDSVERVMSLKHILGGNELAVDRANPKEKQGLNVTSSRGTGSQSNMNFIGQQMGMPSTKSHSFQEFGSQGIAGLGVLENPTPVMGEPLQHIPGQSMPSHGSFGNNAQFLYDGGKRLVRSSSNVGMPLPNPASNPYQSYGGYSYGSMENRILHSPNNSPRSHPIGSLDPLSPSNASYLSSQSSSLNDIASFLSGRSDLSQHGPKGESVWSGSNHSNLQKSTGPASARAGPRIFVGKLSKETSESDLRAYFGQFGFVLDVYLPRDKLNKKDHRGFGFITYETGASVHRVLSHGTHILHGSTLAIDCAVPRASQEETMPAFRGLDIPNVNSSQESTQLLGNITQHGANELQQYFQSLNLSTSQGFDGSRASLDS